MKKYEAAIADFDEMIKIDPNSRLGYVYRGQVLAVLKKYEAAIADFDEVIKLDPDLSSGYHYRARCWRALEKYDRAIKDYDKSISLDDSSTSSVYHRGVTRLLSGDMKSADDFKSVIEKEEDATANLAVYAHMYGYVAAKYNGGDVEPGWFLKSDDIAIFDTCPKLIMTYFRGDITEKELLDFEWDVKEEKNVRFFVALSHLIGGEDETVVANFELVANADGKRNSFNEVAEIMLKRLAKK